MVKVQGRVAAVCVGGARPLVGLGRSHRSAFVKAPVDGPVAVGALGVAGDEHVYHAHGGPDQALLVYSRDHYAFWRGEHGLDLPEVGAFAENLTVDGLTEAEVCVGDTFTIGSVTAQVTSPRTPCYKIGVRYGDHRIPVVMQEAGNPGYMLRVLTGGEVRAGDLMTLVDRPAVTMTLAEAARVAARDRDDWEAVERLAAVPGLAAAMRAQLLERLAARDRGDDAPRLFGEGEGDPVA